MIEVTTFSEAGGHPVNEDAFAVCRHPDDPDGWLCFLADGQGGRAGGEVAARVACRVAADAALGQPLRKLASPTVWEAILGQADQAVLADSEAGLTTLLGFCIHGGRFVGGSCGDGAVLVRSGGGVILEVTRGQFKNPPVGSGGATFVPFSGPLVEPWTVLAMSDGVWKYVGWDRLALAVKAPRVEPLAQVLQAAARLPRTGTFPDDFTVVVFEGSA